MRPVYLKLKQLIDFFYKEGEEAYHSLLASNKIFCDGIFLKFDPQGD